MLRGQFFYLNTELKCVRIPFMSYLPGGVEQEGGAGDVLLFKCIFQQLSRVDPI